MLGTPAQVAVVAEVGVSAGAGGGGHTQPPVEAAARAVRRAGRGAVELCSAHLHLSRGSFN